MSANDGSGRRRRRAASERRLGRSRRRGRRVRVGESRLVRGGATVSTFTEETPAAAMPPPIEARTGLLSEAEVAESGLLQERVIEIGEMREEAVVSKQAVVREELVVRKDVEERTERIAEHGAANRGRRRDRWRPIGGAGRER